MIRAFTSGPFTGRHMAAILIAFFAVVMAVNFYMARAAISSFGGVVVDNSYVASQHFNRWLDEAARERALGWRARVERAGDGRIAVELLGVPPGKGTLRVEARHPLGRLPDQRLDFTRAADGRFVSRQRLDAGRWTLRIEALVDGRRWRDEQDFS